jgi:hypothetical protein
MRIISTALFSAAAVCFAQSTDPAQSGWKKETVNVRKADSDSPSHAYTVQPGTKIPLSMINSISTKHAAEGDRIYLETVFPILVDGKIVIPPGSYVAGTVTDVKRPGKVKGRGELYVRFDSLTLPNGVTRDFRSRIGALDGRATEDLDKTEGKVKSEGTKVEDAKTIGTATAAGAGIGGLATRTGMGTGIGAAAGAAAGLVGVLLSRGPDAVLAKGTTLEMVLDRPITYEASEIDNSPLRRTNTDGGPLPSRKSSNNNHGPLGSRFPY